MLGTNLSKIYQKFGKKTILKFKIALISVNIIFIYFINIFIVSLDYKLLAYASRITKIPDIKILN